LEGLAQGVVKTDADHITRGGSSNVWLTWKIIGKWLTVSKLDKISPTIDDGKLEEKS